MTAPIRSASTRGAVTLWRLEVMRTLRTHRWMLLVGVYAFFGVTGPLLARYLEEIIARFGGGEVTITGTDPRPVDGIMQFVGNASQLGLLAVTVVAAGALAIDAHPEFSAFLRTKVTRARTLVLPRFVVAATTAVIALWVGTACAWALTVPLLGGLPAGEMLVGTLFGSLYLAFAVAVVAAMAGVLRSVAGTVFASLAVLLTLPLLAVVPAIARWVPSELLAAIGGLLEGEPVTEYLPSAVVAALLSVALIAVAGRLVERREH